MLFCQLSAEQRRQYVDYLSTQEVGRILAGEANLLAGIGVLRKICNHPDLLLRRPPSNNNHHHGMEKGAENDNKANDYGNPEKAGTTHPTI